MSLGPREGDPDSEPVGALNDDVPLDADRLPKPTNLAPAARKEEAAAVEAEKKNTLRPVLFWIIIALLGIQSFSTSAMMWAYLFAVDFTPDWRIMTAWISASIVQLVGLTFIITRYLFPANE